METLASLRSRRRGRSQNGTGSTTNDIQIGLLVYEDCVNFNLAGSEKTEQRSFLILNIITKSQES